MLSIVNNYIQLFSVNMSTHSQPHTGNITNLIVNYIACVHTTHTSIIMIHEWYKFNLPFNKRKNSLNCSIFQKIQSSMNTNHCHLSDRKQSCNGIFLSFSIILEHCSFSFKSTRFDVNLYRKCSDQFSYKKWTLLIKKQLKQIMWKL